MFMQMSIANNIKFILPKTKSAKEFEICGRTLLNY